MSEILEQYIEKKESERLEKYNKEKLDFLLEEGLFEKEYLEDGGNPEEYPFYEWDQLQQKNVFFKKIPIELSDEEYESLKSKYGTVAPVKEKRPVLATVLLLLSIIIYIVGAFSTITLLAYEALALSLTLLFSHIILGTILLGLASIITRLDNIESKL